CREIRPDRPPKSVTAATWHAVGTVNKARTSTVVGGRRPSSPSSYRCSRLKRWTRVLGGAHFDRALLRRLMRSLIAASTYSLLVVFSASAASAKAANISGFNFN